MQVSPVPIEPGGADLATKSLFHGLLNIHYRSECGYRVTVGTAPPALWSEVMEGRVALKFQSCVSFEPNAEPQRRQK